MNIWDHIFESLKTIFWFKILIFFDADTDPGWKKFGSGINIPDLHYWCYFKHSSFFKKVYGDVKPSELQAVEANGHGDHSEHHLLQVLIITYCILACLRMHV
jgi:hypothetical protein